MKPIAWRSKPGAGFVLFATSLLLAIAFFVWGAITPPLERTWYVLGRLDLGDTELSAGDRALLQRMLLRNPELADGLLDGANAGLVSANESGLVRTRTFFAVRRAATPAVTLSITPAASQRRPARVTARASDAVEEREVKAGETFTWQLPDTGPFPQLIEVDVARPADEADNWSARVRLEERP